MNYTEEQLNQFYKIFGAVAAPGIREGYIVILGRDRANDPVLGVPLVHVLAEQGSFDIFNLLRMAAGFQSGFACDRWVADTDNIILMNALKDLNHNLTTCFPREDRQLPLKFFHAPYAGTPGDFATWNNAVAKDTEPGRKRLRFGAGSSLPGLLLGLNKNEVYKASAPDYPAIASLGMALLAITQGRAVSQAYLQKYREVNIHEVKL